MKKVRINELARELEVKAHEILDHLPGLGVTEKKTHSSSIDEDVAIKLRRLFGQDVPDLPPEPETPAAAPQESQPVAMETPHAPEAAPGGPAAESPAAPAVEEKVPEPVAGKPLIEHPPVRPAHPIRPPLAGSSPALGAVPAASAPPRMAPAPPAAVIAPGRPSPPAARPIPPARPGQVLSGPRQPMPAGVNEPLSPSAPIYNRSGMARGPATPPPAAGTATPSGPGAPMPAAPRQPGRPLAGQPVARPVVPPARIWQPG